MLEVKFETRASRFLVRLPAKQFGQIDRKIAALADDPHPPDCKKLAGFIFWRVDIGEYRIIYLPIGSVLHIPIIGKRNDGEIFRQLKRLAR